MDKEKVFVVMAGLKDNTIEEEGPEISEMIGLVEAAGGEVLASAIQNRQKYDPAYFIGKGKAEEIKRYINELEVDTVVFGNDLTGSQIRNLEDILEAKIVDRTTLILDIFADRATTGEGRLQVKLAQLKYRLPRLQGFGKALSRTGGGIGTRGPGEQKIETDRRHIRREISNLEEELDKISENRELKRKKRIKSEIPIVALTGYTNAGKSTVMNAFLNISEEEDINEREVFVKDMLFATLDTSLRRIKLKTGEEFILTDTVGFVSNLPTLLIEAFKSTLEEIRYADLILNVIDLSDKEIEHQIETTETILNELNSGGIPRINVFNKKDKVDHKAIYTGSSENSIVVSAIDLEDIELLGKKIIEKLPKTYHDVEMEIPFSKMKIYDLLSTRYPVKESNFTEFGVDFKTRIDEEDYNRYKEFIRS